MRGELLGLQFFCLDKTIEVHPVPTGRRTQQAHRLLGHFHAAINTESDLRLSARLDAAGAVVPGRNRAEVLHVVAQQCSRAVESFSGSIAINIKPTLLHSAQSCCCNRLNSWLLSKQIVVRLVQKKLSTAGPLPFSCRSSAMNAQYSRIKLNASTN